MPDWITHAAASALVPMIRRRRVYDARLLVIGAFLPDSIRLMNIAIDAMNLSGRALITHLEPFHSPFICALIAFAIALFTRTPGKSFVTILLFALLHLLLDACVRKFGNTYVLLGYPFTTDALFRGFIPYYSKALLILPVLLLPLLGVLYARHKPNALFTFNARRIPLALAILALVTVFPFLTADAFVRSGYHHFAFFDDPASYEGKHISFTISKVTCTRPLRVKEMGREYILDTAGRNYGVREGDTISFDGVYRGGIIHVTRLVTSFPFFKNFYSLVGLAFGVLVFLKGRFDLKALASCVRRR